MRKLLNIILTLAVLGGAVAGGAYLRRTVAPRADVDTDTYAAEETKDREILLAKPEGFSFNAVLQGSIVEGEDGLSEFKQGDPLWDLELLRINSYLSTMLRDNSARGEERLSDKDIIDAGIIFLRGIVEEGDSKQLLDAWSVTDSQEVQSYADKYIKMANGDGYDEKTDIKDLANDSYPRWTADRYTDDSPVIYDLSGVKVPDGSACKVPPVIRESLRAEYESRAAALQAKEYKGAVVIPDSAVDVQNPGTDFYESPYSSALRSPSIVLATAATTLNKKAEAELGHPVITLDGKYFNEQMFQEFTSMVNAIYEASVHLNSYSVRGLLGSPLDVHALQTGDTTLLTIMDPTYLSAHALYWTIAAEYMKHYGLQLSDIPGQKLISSPLLAGTGPERFGEGVLYWTSGVDASVTLGKCLAKHYLKGTK